MFTAPLLSQQEAIVAPAPDQGALNQPAGAQPDPSDFLRTIGEQERISKVRDQNQLLDIVNDPKTNDAIALTAVLQLNRHGDERAAETLFNLAVSSARSDNVRRVAIAGLGNLALETPELRERLGQAIHRILTEPGQPEGVRASAGFYAVVLGHPDSKTFLKQALSDSSTPTSLRILAACADPVAGLPILASVAKDPKATPDERAQALTRLAIMDPDKIRLLVTVALDKATPPDLRLAIFGNTVSTPGLLPNSILETIALDEELSVTERSSATVVLCRRGTPEVAPVLRRILANFKDDGVEISILTALSSLGVKEDRQLMQAQLRSNFNNAAAFRYFTLTEPQLALEEARRALEKPASEKVANNFEFAAVLTLATLGNELDMKLVVDRYGSAVESFFGGDKKQEVLEALAKRGQLGVLDQVMAKYGENDSSMALARTQAGSEGAVQDLLSHLPDRTMEGTIVTALLRSKAAAATQFVFEKLCARDTRIRSVVDVELRNPEMFAHLTTQLRSLGGEHAAYADALVKAKAQGIDHACRFRPQDLSHIVETRLSQTGPQPGEKQALVIVPRSDWNGAFNNLAKDVADLRKQGYRIVLFEAANESDVVDAFKKNSVYGASDLIILAAHGSPKAMSFGGVDPGSDHEANETLLIDLSDRNELLVAEVRAALKEGGRVLLESCSTGAATPDNQNLVRFFREVFPQAAELGISGPVQPSIMNGIMFDEHGNFKRADWNWVEPLFVFNDAMPTWQQLA